MKVGYGGLSYTLPIFTIKGPGHIFAGPDFEFPGIYESQLIGFIFLSGEHIYGLRKFYKILWHIYQQKFKQPVSHIHISWIQRKYAGKRCGIADSPKCIVALIYCSPCLYLKMLRLYGM